MFLVSGCDEHIEYPQTTPDLSGVACPARIGVWPVWELEDLPTPEALAMLSHLVIAFALPQADGGLDTSYVDATLERLAPKLEASDIDLVLSIGGAIGYGDAYIKLSQDAETRARFVSNVTDYVQKSGFSGVDIDWELWTRQAVDGLSGNDPVESALLLNLVNDLRVSLPESVTLSTDIFAGPHYGPQYLPALADHTDMINLMAFDFTGAWDGSRVGHHADFTTFKLAINDVEERGFPTHKLMLGIPAYAVQFENGKTHEVTKLPNRAIALMSETDASVQPNTGKFGHTYYETPELAVAKTRIGLEKRVAGFFLFDLSQDSADAEWSILQAINKTIVESKCERIPPAVLPTLLPRH